MLVLALLRSADHIATAWQLMLDPFIVFTLDIPILLATLFTLAILDER